jgi:hypothetical protein
MVAVSYESLGVALRVATVVVPVAVYFLLLGLLNSRRHPQLLTGQQDFVLLMVALCPLFVLPILGAVGVSPASVLVVGAAMAGAFYLLAPKGRNWVIYNMPVQEAKATIAEVIGSLGAACLETNDGLSLPDENATIQIGGFPMLRNVTVRVRGGGKDFLRRFQAALDGRLASIPAQTSPAAVSLLLVATALLVVPVTLMVHRVPEIVRILTDLLH